MNIVTQQYTVVLRKGISQLPCGVGIFINNFIHLQHMHTLLPTDAIISPTIKTVLQSGDSDLFYSEFGDGVGLCNIEGKIYLIKCELIHHRHHSYMYYLDSCCKDANEDSNHTVLRIADFSIPDLPKAVYGKNYYFDMPFKDITDLFRAVGVSCSNTHYTCAIVSDNISGIYNLIGQCIKLFGSRGETTYNQIKQTLASMDNPVVVVGRTADNSISWNIADYNEAVFIGLPMVGYNFA